MKQTFKPLADFIEDIEDYVHESHNHERGLKLIIERKDFGKQPPKLGDFIPCDKEGKPLECPQGFYDWHGLSPDEVKECKLYKEALERVKFEGFEVEHYSYTIGFMIGIKYLRYWKNGMGFEIGLDTPKTLEDLTTLGLTLKHKI